MTAGSGADSEAEAAETPAEHRLHARVEAILTRASSPADLRSDLHEELYAGLWARWQDELASGLDPETAADRAMDAFGQPATLGPELTLTYHSRLYASTIGALVPAIADVGDKPLGLRRLITFVIVVAGSDLLVGIAGALTFSPTRAVVAGIVAPVSAIACLLAARALWRGQRWALAAARLLVVLSLVTWAPALVGPSHFIDLIGVAALVALLPAFGPDIAGWVAPSRSIGYRLGIAVTAAVFAVSALGPAVNAIPEITAAGPADLHLSVTAVCTWDGTPEHQEAVTADFTWNRVDLLPDGLRGDEQHVDYLSLWFEGTPAVGSVDTEMLLDSGRYYQTAWSNWGGIRDLDAPSVQVGGGARALSDSPAAIPGSAVGPWLGSEIPIRELRAGHMYQAEWGYLPMGEGVDPAAVR